MNLSRADIALRERRFWESADVGGLMFRRWLVPIVVFFGLPYTAVAAGLLISIAHLPPWLPAAAIWWLNPLWDRLVMVPAGVLLFEPGAAYGTMARAMTRLLSPSLAADLTWRRFNPFRAYLIPVSMYERPEPGERAKRTKWLRKNVGGQLIGIAALFLGLQTLVAVSMGLTLTGLSALGVVAYRGAGDGVSTPMLYSVSYALAVLCVEPLYALSCFSIYINRRTTAEGWDLQLAFSRLRTRFPAGAGKSFLLVLLMVFSFQAVAAHAQQAQPASPGGSEALFVQRARKVLSGSEFGGTVQRRELTLKRGALNIGRSRRLSGNALLDLLSAEALRIVVLSIAVGLAIYAIVINRRRLPRLKRRARGAKPNRIETLPAGEPAAGEDGWIDEARRAWEDGSFRQAIGILYRGSLLMARRSYGIAVSESATERECVRIVRDVHPPPAFLATFEDLTRMWVTLAWAGRAPQAMEFDRLCTTLAGLGEAHESQ